jgi:hypothetical protein
MTIVDPQYDPTGKKRNFDQQVYLASPEFNALRKELFENWNNPSNFHKNYFEKFSWFLAFDGATFVELMNAELGLISTGFDSFDEAGHCKRILNALRVKRGVSEL